MNRDERRSDPPLFWVLLIGLGMKTLSCAEMAGTEPAMRVDKPVKACV